MSVLLLLAVAWLLVGCAVAWLFGKVVDFGDRGASSIALQGAPSLTAADDFCDILEVQ